MRRYKFQDVFSLRTNVVYLTWIERFESNLCRGMLNVFCSDITSCWGLSKLVQTVSLIMELPNSRWSTKMFKAAFLKQQNNRLWIVLLKMLSVRSDSYYLSLLCYFSEMRQEDMCFGLIAPASVWVYKDSLPFLPPFWSIRLSLLWLVLGSEGDGCSRAGEDVFLVPEIKILLSPAHLCSLLMKLSHNTAPSMYPMKIPQNSKRQTSDHPQFLDVNSKIFKRGSSHQL